MADPTGYILLDAVKDDETVALADATQAEIHAKEAVKHGKAWKVAHGKAAEAARQVAAQLLDIRRTFRDRRGNVDWNGSSNSYVKYLGLRVWQPIFGKDAGPKVEGYNSFQSAVRREVGILRETRSKLDKSDPLYFPTAAQSGAAGSAQASGTKSDVQTLREHVSAIGSGMTKTFGADPMHSAQAALGAITLLLDAIKRPAVKMAPKTVAEVSDELDILSTRIAECGLLLDIRKDGEGNLPDDFGKETEGTETAEDEAVSK